MRVEASGVGWMPLEENMRALASSHSALHHVRIQQGIDSLNKKKEKKKEIDGLPLGRRPSLEPDQTANILLDFQLPEL